MKKLKLIASIALIAIFSITDNAFCMKRKRDDLEKIQASHQEQRQTSEAPPAAAAQSDDQHPSKRQKKAKNFRYPEYKRIQHNDTTRRLFQAIEQADYSTVEEILNDNPKIVLCRIAQRTGSSATYYSPLHKAITCYTKKRNDRAEYQRLLDIIKLILVKGANPNEKHRNLYTPLDRLLPKRRCSELINLLISKGTNQYKPYASEQMFKKYLVNNAQILLDNNLLPNNWFQNSMARIIHFRPMILKAFKTNRYDHLKSITFDHTTPLHGKTPLHIAVRSSINTSKLNEMHLDFIKTFITKENINKKDNEDETPLSLSLKSRNLKNSNTVLQLLISSGAQLDPTQVYLCLHRAINFRNTEAINYIIQQGYNVAQKDANGNNPLHILTADHNPYKIVQLAEFFIGKRCNTNGQNIEGNTPLHNLALCDELCTADLKLAKLLMKNGAVANLLNNNGDSPLSLTKSPELAKILIEKGCDINRQNAQGNTPLHNLALCDELCTADLKLAKLLMKNGAVANLLNSNGDSPLSLTKSPELAKILIEKGCDINRQNAQGNTPLHNLALCDELCTADLKLAKLLMKNGAVTNLLNSNGDSPLSLAVRKSLFSLAKFLIDAGADTNHPKINLANIFYNYHEQLYQLLVRSGARLGINLENLKEQRTQIIKKWEHLCKMDKMLTPEYLQQHTSQTFCTLQEIDRKIEDVNIDIDKLKEKRNQVIEDWKDILEVQSMFTPEDLKQRYQKVNQTIKEIDQRIKNAEININKLKSMSIKTIIYWQRQQGTRKMLTPEYLKQRYQKVNQTIKEIDQRIEHETYLLAQHPHLHTLYSNYLHAHEITFKLRQIITQILSESYLNASQIEKYFSAIREILTTLYQLVHSDLVATSTKLYILDVLAEFNLVYLQKINEKLKLNQRFGWRALQIQWNDLLRQIPFNLFLLKSRYSRNLKKIVMRRLDDQLTTKDMNGETFLQAQCKHVEHMLQSMVKKWELFFSVNRNDFGTTKQMTPLTKKLLLLLKQLKEEDSKDNSKDDFKKEFEKNPLTKEISKRIIMPLRDNKSYRHNPYHKAFMNFCAMFPMLQAIEYETTTKDYHTGELRPATLILGGNIAANIMKYIHPKDLFDGKSYVPSRNYYESPSTEEKEEEEEEVRGRRRQTTVAPPAAAESEYDDDVEFLDD